MGREYRNLKGAARGSVGRNYDVSKNIELAESYLRQPYARVILPEEDGTFRGEIVEFPGCITSGDTPSSTLKNLEEVARSWLITSLDLGQLIPRPFDSSHEFSGRLVLRIPKSLHKKAAWMAEIEGVSLNQFISTSLAETIGEKRGTRNVIINFVKSNVIRHQLPPTARSEIEIPTGTCYPLELSSQPLMISAN